VKIGQVATTRKISRDDIEFAPEVAEVAYRFRYTLWRGQATRIGSSFGGDGQESLSASDVVGVAAEIVTQLQSTCSKHA
jgi:hypothetical protein